MELTANVPRRDGLGDLFMEKDAGTDDDNQDQDQEPFHGKPPPDLKIAW
jgi:hypothetical protein